MGGLPGYEISVISDTTAISTLLAAQGFDRSPFQSSPWLKTWFAVFKPSEADCYLGLIRKSAGGQPLFLLPLIRERCCGIRVLIPPDRGISDYHSALISPEFTPDAATLNRLWAALVAMLPKADMLALDRVPPEYAERMGLTHLMRPSSCSAHSLPIDADFAALRERRFDPSTARRLVKNRRKLDNKGSLIFDLVAGPEALADLERLLDWRQKRFQNLMSERDAAVQRSFYNHLIEAGDLGKVGRLRLDGRLIAGCLALIENGRILILTIAYDKAFANWAPGLLAFESCIAEAAKQGLTLFDLTIGDESYKQFFGADCTRLLELRQPLTLRGRLVLALHDLKPKVKCVLQRLGIFEFLQRLRGKRPGKS